MDNSKLKQIAPTLLSVGVVFLVLRTLSAYADKITPEKESDESKEQRQTQKSEESGIVKEQFQTSPQKLNLKRFATDTAIAQRVNQLKIALNTFPTADQTAIQNVLINTRSDADYNAMKKLFGEVFDLRPTQLNWKNLDEWLNSRMTTYSKQRVNQSWKINKKYPTQITFLWA